MILTYEVWWKDLGPPSRYTAPWIRVQRNDETGMFEIYTREDHEPFKLNSVMYIKDVLKIQRVWPDRSKWTEPETEFIRGRIKARGWSAVQHLHEAARDATAEPQRGAERPRSSGGSGGGAGSAAGGPALTEASSGKEEK